MYSEYDLGMETFLTDNLGIGGRLRREPEDFIVNELSRRPEENEEGRFTAAVIKSRNWETNRLVRRLARNLGISRNRIQFAGTKDKRAVTTQLFVFSTSSTEVKDLNIPDVDVLEVYCTDRQIKLGDLLGNEFEVAVREMTISKSEVKERVESIGDTVNVVGGFPNFFGVQRFGAVRPITHKVGRSLINGDFKGAVRTYVANPMEGESKEEFEARQAFEKSGDYSEALRTYPRSLSFEKAILNHLVNHGDDYVGALYKLPKNLLMMFVHSYQSYLFNRIVSARLKNGLALNEPMIGDLVLPVDKFGLPDHDRWIMVGKGNVEKLRSRCKENKAFVSGVLFGSEVEFASGETGEIERRIVEREELAPEDFIIPRMPDLSSRGTRRELLAPLKELRTEVLDDHVLLRFQLTKGCYATSLLREFMKSEDIMDY